MEAVADAVSIKAAEAVGAVDTNLATAVVEAAAAAATGARAGIVAERVITAATIVSLVKAAKAPVATVK